MTAFVRQMDLLWCSSVLKRCDQWRNVLSLLTGMNSNFLTPDEYLGCDNQTAVVFRDLLNKKNQMLQLLEAVKP